MTRVLDARIRTEHIAKYGVDDTERYLAVIADIPELPDSKRGEDHHLLAKSIWPQYADLKVNPWNRLRVSHAVHTALSELQGEFEGRLRVAALMMKGQTAEAQLEAVRKGGRIQGKKNVESGHMGRIQRLSLGMGGGISGRITGKKNVESGLLAKLRTPEHQRKAGIIGGMIQGRRNVESGQLARIQSMGGKASGKKNVESGHLVSIASLGGKMTTHIRWHVNRPGGFNPNCKLCFQVI